MRGWCALLMGLTAVGAMVPSVPFLRTPDLHLPNLPDLSWGAWLLIGMFALALVITARDFQRQRETVLLEIDEL